jgi:hypothetical protein
VANEGAGLLEVEHHLAHGELANPVTTEPPKPPEAGG